MEQDNKSKKDNFKNAMCYIPIVSVILFFTETNRSDELNKNIKYGFFLLLAYVILLPFLGGLITLIYLGISGFLFYKAYNGEDVELEVFDNLEKTVKEKMEDNKTYEISKTTTKEDKVNSEEKEDPLEDTPKKTTNNTKKEL